MNTGEAKWFWALWEFARPILFPEHHRKITRTTQWVGITLLLGTPFLQWLIQILIAAGISSALGLPLSALAEYIEGGQPWGFGLIIASLIYSAVILWIQSADLRASQTKAAQDSQNVLHRDFQLYQRFLERFKTGGPLENFICHHNFGGSWRRELDGLFHEFMWEWSAPEIAFQEPDIAASFSVLLTSMKDLEAHLTEHSSPLRANGDLSCIFDPTLHDEFDGPRYIDEAITEANRLGVLVRDQRVAFIRLANGKFAALPVEI